jgi:hypothetical protein
MYMLWELVSPTILARQVVVVVLPVVVPPRQNL